MSGLLAGQVAVITGASRPNSIGTATGKLFLQHGAKVALLDVNPNVTRIAADIGNSVMGITCDVCSEPQTRDAIDDIAEKFGRIDILVNSAGLVRSSKILDITPEEYETVLDTNLRGTFHLVRAVIPHMRRAGGGAIVCMSSIAGESGGGVFGTAHYAAAKAGIFGLAKGLARELAPEGIRCNAVAPGPIDNDFTEGAMTREIKDEIAKKIPMGRLGTAEDVAGVCLFLASELSSFVTGTVVDVNGGLLIH